LPILPNLLRYETFAVADYGCMSHALHLRQTQQSLNLGQNILVITYATASHLNIQPYSYIAGGNP
jgi:hypothetical protein